jgi:DNA-binding response OmpR family regulator
MSFILLVDDDDSFRTMLRITLGKMQHEVIEARNGREALALYATRPPDLVITDLVMPEKEGMETIRELRQKYPGVKIIAMSGGGRVSAVDYLKISKTMGAKIILAKPFSNDELETALSSLLAESVS